MAAENKKQKFHHGNLSDALIEAAIGLIVERNDASFSLREVALSVGVSHAAAYRHFASKPDLIASIAVRGFEALRFALERAIVKNGGAIDVKKSARLMGNAYIDFALTNAGAYRTLFHPDICDPVRFAALHAASFASLQVLSDLMQTGLSQSLIDAKYDAAQLATSVWAGLHGYVSLLLDGQIIEEGDQPAPKAGRELFLDFMYDRMFIA